MKRNLAEFGPTVDGQRSAKKQRTEAPGGSQSVPLASSEPATRALPSRGGDVAPAQSMSPPIAYTADTSSERVRFRVETSLSPVAAGSIPVKTADQPRIVGQMIDENDLRALRALLQRVARGEIIVDKADLLRHAARTGKLDAFNLLVEFGALQALRDEAPRADRRSLLEYVALGQNLEILDRLEASGLAVRAFARDKLMAAIRLSARKGDLAFLRRLDAAADSAGIRFQPADMRAIFMDAVQHEKNERCQRISSPAVMEWLVARYPCSVDASVFAAPLWKSVDVGNWRVAEYLLGVCGASPQLTGENNQSLLMLAAARGRHDLYELLRFHDADPHAVDADGQSVLHHAVQGEAYSIVSDLVLQCRVNTFAQDNQGRTAVDLATQLGKQHFVTVLQSQPMKIDYLASL